MAANIASTGSPCVWLLAKARFFVWRRIFESACHGIYFSGQHVYHLCPQKGNACSFVISEFITFADFGGDFDDFDDFVDFDDFYDFGDFDDFGDSGGHLRAAPVNMLCLEPWVKKHIV